ncbi:MAG TPA: molybdopterin cofactor-binding domain-containing protein, partial [Ilumatobacteraceae bacterium]
MTAATKPRFIRADGPDKVTGSGRYTADLTLTGMLAAKFRYAGVAHARITRLDVSAARQIPGVMAVLTAADVPDVHFGPFVQDRTLFARDVVRFEGDVVAAVAATTAAIAQRAVDAIVVEYEPLPIVTDLQAALAVDAPLVHAEWESYGAADVLVRDRNDASFSSISKGDVEAGLAEADHVITSRYVADGSHAAPIEPRAVVAQWEGNKVTIWTSTQVPFDARAGVCETLQLPANRVRIIVPHLGGGFGGKCGFHYEAHVAALARAAKRPVRLVFSRREEFIAPDRRREQMIIDITTGVRNDGTITARKAWVAIDNGAYTADSGFFSQLAGMHVAGPYRVPNLHVEAHLVYTNHQPSGSVRAPTAPQCCWALESHTDEIAAAIGMDPVAFRK